MAAKRHPSAPSINAVPGTQKVILPLMLAAGVLLVLLYNFAGDENGHSRWDLTILDQFHREGRKTVQRDDLVVLGIDDASMTLDSLWPEDLEASPALQLMKRRWPYPRRVWALLADRLIAAGARGVFLDLTFNTQDNDPDGDQHLREVLQRHPGKIILGAKFEKGSGMAKGSNVQLSQPNDVVLGEGGVMENAVGLLSFWSDSDGVIRSVVLRMRSDEAEARLFGPEGMVVNPDEKPMQACSVFVAELLKPGVTRSLPGEQRFRYGPMEAYPHMSLYEVFVDALWESNFQEGAVFKDKVVLVGAVATQLQDFQATPYGQLPGVAVHAHAAAAMLEGEFLKPMPSWWFLASMGAGALVAWLVAGVVRQPLLSLLGLALFSVVGWYFCQYLFNSLNWEAHPLPFLLALNVCGLTGLSGNYYLKMRETQKLQRFLARYTSPELVREMMQDRAGIYTTLKGQKKVVTILFSDVRGFTSMSEAMEASQMVSQLNEYLNLMVSAVVQHRGLVDKFIGDAVMALWGSVGAAQGEEAERDAATNAVKAALKMREYLQGLNDKWQQQGLEPFKIGIGIHQGEVVSGNIGSDSPHEKMDMTVIGDNVNLASRLEGVTKGYGVDLVISDAVRLRLRDEFVLRSVDLVVVKGKKKPVEIFTVPGMKGESVPGGLEAFERGIRAYREGRFTEGLAAFIQARGQGMNDALTGEYCARCEDLIKNPPDEWTGVYVMTTK